MVNLIGVMASVYGWVPKTVISYQLAADRVRFQKELAQEIHDGVQYLLAAIGARLDLARRLVPEDPDRAVRILGEERDTVRRAGDELRYLVRRLRPDAHQVDLTAVLRQQVASLADRWAFDLDVDPDRLPRLAPAAEHAILRVIQENLTNAAKHAQASRVEVRLGVTGQTLRCTVCDDGVGFEPQTTLGGKDGSGLSNLRERVAAGGGSLEIQSAPGRGMAITAEFRIPGGDHWGRLGS